MQEYKPPSSKDIPIDFRVELLKDAPNPIGVLGSKGITLYDIAWSEIDRVSVRMFHASDY